MKATVKWLVGKPDANGNATHILQDAVSHVTVDKSGNHTAHCGTASVSITKEQWWDLQGIKKE
jgi:hypothetical protein